MAHRVLTAEQQQEAFSLLGDPKNFGTNAVVSLFAYTKKHGIRFHPDDEITVGPADSPFVKDNSKTTLGIYIVNKFLFEDLGIFGYINKTINGKLNEKIDAAISDALTSGELSHDAAFNYIDRCQYLFGGPLALVINTSLSENLMTLPNKARSQLNSELKEKKDLLAENDPQVSHEIEQEVVTTALEEMRKKNDPALALFDSGCGIDPYNNYRTMFVMKGAIIDNTGESPTGYKIVTSNYNDGITKEDMPLIADSLVTSAYSKGVSTQDSGTNAKKYNASSQSIRLQPRGSDCKTTDTISVTITKDNADSYKYRFILDKGKLVMLTPENIEKYYGTTVKMRSGICCKAKNPEYCNVCAGDRLYRIGIRNIGLTFNTISGSTLNSAMKRFHDISIKLFDVDIDDILQYAK